MRDLDGVLLITGAASGIGRATALAFAQAGANVALADMNIAGLEETRGLVHDVGREAITILTDVTSEADTEAMVTTTVDHFGRLDYAVNSAGVGGSGHTWGETPVSAWDRIVDINLKGVWLCMKAQLSSMSAHGRGSVVNLSSIYGLAGTARSAAYTAAKHGVIGLTKSAALAYAEQGIRVNAVCPAHIDTPMTALSFTNDSKTLDAVLDGIPMRRLGGVEEIASSVLWLASDKASFVTGHALSVDGGYAAH